MDSESLLGDQFDIFEILYGRLLFDNAFLQNGLAKEPKQGIVGDYFAKLRVD